MGLGAYRHLVHVENPGPPVPDGAGGYLEGWSAATPATLHVAITPATARDLERVAAGTVITQATHLVRGRWHPQITTASRLLFDGRILSVIHLGNPEERSREAVLVCAELVTHGS